MRKRYRSFLPLLVPVFILLSGWGYVAGQEKKSSSGNGTLDVTLDADELGRLVRTALRRLDSYNSLFLIHRRTELLRRK